MRKYQEQEITIIQLNQKVAMAEINAKAVQEKEKTFIEKVKELTIELRNAKIQIKEKTNIINNSLHIENTPNDFASKTREEMLERQV